MYPLCTGWLMLQSMGRRTCVYQLRNIARILPVSHLKDTESTLHSLISSHLDHCNTLLALIENQEVLTRVNRLELITPLWASLHWHPVHFTIDFKVILSTYNWALNGLTPQYITELLLPYTTLLTPRDPLPRAFLWKLTYFYPHSLFFSEF